MFWKRFMSNMIDLVLLVADQVHPTEVGYEQMALRAAIYLSAQGMVDANSIRVGAATIGPDDLIVDDVASGSSAPAAPLARATSTARPAAAVSVKAAATRPAKLPRYRSTSGEPVAAEQDSPTADGIKTVMGLSDEEQAKGVEPGVTPLPKAFAGVRRAVLGFPAVSVARA